MERQINLDSYDAKSYFSYESDSLPIEERHDYFEIHEDIQRLKKHVAKALQIMEDEQITFEDVKECFTFIYTSVWVAMSKRLEVEDTTGAGLIYHKVIEEMILKNYKESILRRGIFDGFTRGGWVLNNIEANFSERHLNRNLLNHVLHGYRDLYDSMMSSIHYFKFDMYGLDISDVLKVHTGHTGVGSKRSDIAKPQATTDPTPENSTAPADEAPAEAISKVDRLTAKQKVLLLHKAGVFDLPAFKGLPDTQLGEIFGSLLECSTDNTRTNIAYRQDGAGTKHFLYTDRNIEKVNEFILKHKINL